jgi:hypothetical protein
MSLKFINEKKRADNTLSRIIKRNLVYIIGIPEDIAKQEVPI